MKVRKTHRLIVTLLIACSSLTGFGQKYPVYVSTQLTPPYSLSLSDYAALGSQKLVVTIQVTDVTVTNLPVRLHLKLETMTGVTIETVPNITTLPIYLTGGEAPMLFWNDPPAHFKIKKLTF